MSVLNHHIKQKLLAFSGEPYYEKLLQLQKFINPTQLLAMINGALKNTESNTFRSKLIELAERIDTMPKTYEQDGLGDNATAYLHFFTANGHWYITELDIEDGVSQAFGLATINNHDPELGYISIAELVKYGVALDVNFPPTSIGQVRTMLEAGPESWSPGRAGQALNDYDGLSNALH